MAVRIHYRHGLLHSSKNRQKHFSQTSIQKVTATVVLQHKLNTFHSIRISLSHPVTDNIWLQAPRD